MEEEAAAGTMAEEEFAALVDLLAAHPGRQEHLAALLREEHPVYDQRGVATIVRMRGWILVALSRVGVSDATLLFVLEELDTGVEPYLVAASACALRTYPRPAPAFAPFVMRALANIRYRNERVSFKNYGEYAASSAGTNPVRELLLTLQWLGPHARGVLSDVEALRKQGAGLPKKLLIEVDRAVESIGGAGAVAGDSCCALSGGIESIWSWSLNSRRSCWPIGSIVFEDQAAELITFKEFFQGYPSVVVFFYTRCDNPLKCSLTVTKLGRIQKLLEAQALAGQIRTAAITYDPAFDLPERLRAYGRNRGVTMDARHRMLRATAGAEMLRRHFRLGVNFIGSLVNRHRVELYILDARGRIAASFGRVRWDEQQVVDRVRELLKEKSDKTISELPPESVHPPGRFKIVATVFGVFASIGVAFFPKCPICWAAYLSMFGIVGSNQIPYSPWLQPLLVAAMLINIASVWLRGRLTGRMSGFYLVVAGALMIVISKLGLGLEKAAAWGVLFTLSGSLLSAPSFMRGRSNAASI